MHGWPHSVAPWLFLLETALVGWHLVFQGCADESKQTARQTLAPSDLLPRSLLPKQIISRTVRHQCRHSSVATIIFEYFAGITLDGPIWKNFLQPRHAIERQKCFTFSHGGKSGKWTSTLGNNHVLSVMNPFGDRREVVPQISGSGSFHRREKVSCPKLNSKGIISYRRCLMACLWNQLSTSTW